MFGRSGNGDKAEVGRAVQERRFLRGALAPAPTNDDLAGIARAHLLGLLGEIEGALDVERSGARLGLIDCLFDFLRSDSNSRAGVASPSARNTMTRSLEGNLLT